MRSRRGRNVLQTALNTRRVATLLMVLFAAPSAAASGVQYHAPAACPSETEVRARWARELAAGGVDAPFELTITQQRAGYRGEARRPNQERVLVDSSCAALVEALLLALSLDAHDVPDVGTARATPPLRGFLGAELGAELGLQPAAAPGFGLRGGLARGPLALEGYAFAMTPLRGTSPSGREALFQAAHAGAVLCVLAGERWAGGPCAGAEIAWIHGTGRSVDTSRSADTLAFAPVVAVRGALALGRGLALTASVTTAFPLSRRPFEVAGETVHRASWANLRVALGLQWWL